MSHLLGPQIPRDSGSVEIVLFISKVGGIKQEAQGPTARQLFHLGIWDGCVFNIDEKSLNFSP